LDVYVGRLLLLLRQLYRWLTPRRFWWLMALTTIAHLAFVLLYNTHPGVDGVIYQRVARTLAEAGSLVACRAFDNAFWPPLFCIYLGGLYVVFGESHAPVVVLNVVIALAASCVALPYLKAMFGDLTARWSSLLFYNSIMVYFFTCYYKYELLAALLLGISLVCVLTDGQPSWKRLALGGVAMGLAGLTTGRVLVLIIPLLYLVFTRYRNSGWRRVTGAWLVYLFCTAVVISPWTVRNYICLQKFIPITSNSGYNFYMGFNLTAGGSYNYKDRWPAPYNLIPRTDNAAYYRGGLDYIRNHPDRAVLLVLKKTFIMWRTHYADSVIVYPFFWFGVMGLHRLLGADRRQLARTVQMMFLVYTAVHCLFIARYYYLLPLLPIIYGIALTSQRWLGRRLLDRSARLG
jgi:4-amino-4-deoxy-L-arabinose transferase-like glycosyltransferase